MGQESLDIDALRKAVEDGTAGGILERTETADIGSGN